MAQPVPAKEKAQACEKLPPFARAVSAGPVRLTIVCAAILAALTVVTTTYFFSNLRDHVLSENRRQLENTASLLARQIGHLFDAVRSVHAEVVTLVSYETPLHGELLRELTRYEVHQKLRDKIAGMPYVGSLAMFDAQGDLVNFSRQWPLPPINVADHQFFHALKADADAATFLGEPVYHSASGTRAMHLASRLNGPAGEFLGVVSAALELEYFQRYFEGVELTPDDGIGLFRADGMLLMRHPIADSDIGRVFANVLPLQLVANADRGIGQSNETLDGRERIVAAHRVANYPLVVAAANTVDGALADWRKAANYLAIVVGFVILGIAGFAWLFIRLFRTDQAFAKIRMERSEAERIREQNIRFNAALNNMTQGLLMFDASARVVVCNERYLQMYRLTPEQIIPGMALAEVVRRRAESGSFIGDQEIYCAEILAAIAVGQSINHVHETSDGRTIYVVNRPMDNGGWVATHEDVTDRTRAEKERDHNRKLLDLVVDNVPATITVKDPRDLKYVLVNRAGEQHYGITREEMIGKTVHEVLPATSAELVTSLDRQFLQMPDRPSVDEYTIETPGSGTRTSIVTRLPILSDSGDLQYLLAVVNDVTERREAEARIVHMAHHDALTELPNRTLLRELLEREVAEASDVRRVAVHYLDLDNFKSVNDTLGHIAGDELIKGVARRMHACLGKGDMIARFGGDEFVIVQTGVERPLDAADLAQAVRGAVARMPFDVSGHQVAIDVSIGIALAPEDSCCPDELLKFADMALYGAKADGRGTYQFFEPKLDARMKSRRDLEIDLRQALKNEEFELHYQPVIAMHDNSVSGFEALLRWRHPTRGMVSPAEFIPIAEEIGLIAPLSEWVLREACAEAAQWPDGLRVAVNISPVHFIGQNLVQAVVDALAASSLPADRLEIEITEAVLLQSTERTLNTMQLLHDLGARIAMDDFGIGYSSLSYLRNFPFDKIKIDRSFIQDIERQANSRAIVRAVVALGNSLGMTTTAEGIETEAQMEILRAEGCAEMQGYLFSPARPGAEIRRLFLRHHGARRRAAA